VRFPQRRDQAALHRKAGNIRDRLLADTKKKTRQAERMLGSAASLSSSTKKKSREAELLAKDSAKVRVRETAMVQPIEELPWKRCPSIGSTP
jgi:Lutheran blood group glycoprotein